MGEETEYEYDASGNRTSVLDAKGQKLTYIYDELNRLTQINYYAAGDYLNPIKTIDLTYNKLGRILSYTDGTTSAIYTYDDLQRKTGETVDYGTFILIYSYTYYANSMKKTFTGPDGITYTYNYDNNNRLSGMNIPGQGQITYNTYNWNSPSKITLPGGAISDYTYTPLMQLEAIDVKDPGENTFMNYTYTHSPAGNITAKNTEHGNYEYQYDKLYRLTDAVNPASDDETYTYDAIGNRLTSASTMGTWSYNINNELLDYEDVAYSYDDDGNMIQRTVGAQITNYIYDIQDRLVQIEDGSRSVIVEYYYDPFGRRLWKEVSGVRTYYFYSDEGLIGEYDSGGNEIKTYGYGPDSMWGTNPMFQKVGSSYYWYINDHLGTPQVIIDTTGRVVWAATYDSFGNAQISTAEIENNLRFAGQYYDGETGLHYNWNRYYDPVAGRYLRTDPIGFAGGDLNLYAYVWNDAVNWIDPWGLETYEYNDSFIGGNGTGILNLHAKTENDWKAGTAKSGIEVSIAEVTWKGDTKHLSSSLAGYKWRGQLKGGMTNIYSLGGIEAAATIAGIEGQATGTVKIGSIYIKMTLGGTIASLGAEGKIGLRGVKIGLHALIGAAVGLEWGFISELLQNQQAICP